MSSGEPRLPTAPGESRFPAASRRMEPRLELKQGPCFGVRRVLAAFGRRLVAVEVRKRVRISRHPRAGASRERPDMTMAARTSTATSRRTPKKPRPLLWSAVTCHRFPIRRLVAEAAAPVRGALASSTPTSAPRPPCRDKSRHQKAATSRRTPKKPRPLLWSAVTCHRFPLRRLVAEAAAPVRDALASSTPTSAPRPLCRDKSRHQNAATSRRTPNEPPHPHRP